MVGSAAIAVLIDSRLAAEGLPDYSGGQGSGSGGGLPAAVADSFSSAMATSVLLTPAVLAIGFVAVMFFERPQLAGFSRATAAAPTAASRVAD